MKSTEKKRFLDVLFFVIFACFGWQAFCQDNKLKISINPQNLPLIHKLGKNKDQVFAQCIQTVNENKKNIRSNRDLYIEFFRFIPDQNDSSMDLYRICAAFNVPYDTIASLNCIENPHENLGNKTLVIPAFDGVFVPLAPTSPIEILNFKEMESRKNIPYKMTFNLNGRDFYLFPGDCRYSPAARAFFVDSVFRLPLEQTRVTSEFGFRKSPVYHTWKMHNGIDFAAREGTEVYAAKAGTVTHCINNDPIFGNYIIISHDSTTTTVYAHLSKIIVKRNQVVKGGQQIALSGSSGACTGPHLHFEIRTSKGVQDPAKILWKKGKQN